MIPRRGIRIGSFAGIPFGVHPLWFVIVALITWSLAAGWFPGRVDGISPGWAWALGLLSAVLLFASVLAHEYGHAIVARRRGIEVEEIDLWLLGGVARMSSAPQRARDELAYALAGPAVTLVVTAVLGLVLLALPAGAAPALHALVLYELIVNGAMLAFNLLPAFPLDGGRVLRALLWQVRGDPTSATTAAAVVGRGFALVFVGLGVLATLYGAVGGLWFVLIGFFLLSAAGSEQLHAEVQAAFRGVRADALMSTPATCVTAGSSLELAIADVVLADPHPAYPVVEDGRVIGMLDSRHLGDLPPARRAVTPVGEVTDRDPRLRVAPADDVAALLDVPAFVRLMRAVVVDPEDRPLGIVSITDVQRTLEARRRFGAPPATPRGRAVSSRRT